MSSSDSDALPEWVHAYSSPAAAAGAKRKTTIDLADSSDDEHGPPPATTQPPEAAAQPASGAGAKHTAAQPVAASAAAPATQPALAATSAQLPPGSQAGPSQPLGTQTQQEMAMATQINATQEQLPGTSQPGEEAAAPKGEVLLMLPDKLPATKVLLELRPTSNSESAELAGDAGAVGRVVMTKAKEGASDSFQLDLKGVLYDATVLPLAGTALVVNIGPTSAKVEAIMHDFVRLQEDMTVGVETVEGNLGNLLGEDDEVYQLEEDGADGAAGEQGAGAKKKKGAAGDGKPGRKKAPGAGAGRKAGTTISKLGVSGGVKKVRKAGAAKGTKGAKGKAGAPKGKVAKAAGAVGGKKAAAGAKGTGAKGAGKAGAASGEKGKGKGKAGKGAGAKAKSPAKKKKKGGSDEETEDSGDVEMSEGESDVESEEDDDSDYE